MNPSARHRAPGEARHNSYPTDFRPRHCGGYVCMHAHPDEQALPVFAGLDAPVATIRCERTGAHGAHDTTNGRCPGQTDTSLSAAAVRDRMKRVRAGLRGAS